MKYYNFPFPGLSPLLIRHSRSYGIFTKKISPHLVSLIKVEGLFSPYIVIIFDIVNSYIIVGLALHIFEALIEQIKPILFNIRLSSQLVQQLCDKCCSHLKCFVGARKRRQWVHQCNASCNFVGRLFCPSAAGTLTRVWQGGDLLMAHRCFFGWVWCEVALICIGQIQ